jgi:hypothetical protein
MLAAGYAEKIKAAKSLKLNGFFMSGARGRNRTGTPCGGGF